MDRQESMPRRGQRETLKEYRLLKLTVNDVNEIKRFIYEGQSSSGYLFTSTKGFPISYKAVLNNYNEAFKKAELDFSGTHCLRHGAAKEIRRQLGLDGVIGLTGQSPEVADHYSKLTEDDHEKSSTVMSGIFQQKDKPIIEGLGNVIPFPFEQSI